MTQVNMLEAKTDLSKLLRTLPKIPSQKRIGIAEGKFEIPDEFDTWDKEIEEMFGSKI